MTQLLDHSRKRQLQARCAAQRQQLSDQVADVEARLQGTDALLGSIRTVMSKPAVLAGGVALLFTARRSGGWALLSRGVVLAAAARRVYRAFKRNQRR